MPIDPCVDGCLNHNIGTTALPTAGDDPCNSAGNGFFCPGSYWLTTGGDCGDRLFLRTGGDCNVDQWLEIQLAELRSEVVDPVDGTDCCPPGTVWCNTVTGTTWISTNGCTAADDCTWCEICKEQLFTTESLEIPLQNVALPASQIPGNVIASTGTTITNTTNRDMECTWFIEGLQVNIVNQGPETPIANAAVFVSYNGGGTWLLIDANRDITIKVGPAGTVADLLEVNTQSHMETFTLAPGATVTRHYAVAFWLDPLPSQQMTAGTIILDEVQSVITCAAI